MPVLKVSDYLIKEALEVIRLQITVLGNCPQCQGMQYRSGVCEDCAFISPEVQEAIQSWQESQGISQKAASRKLSFADLLPSGGSSRDVECPKCKRRGFNGIQCEDPKCNFEQPPKELGHKRPTFTGIDPKLFLDRRVVFTPSARMSPAGQKIEKQKEKLKKKKGSAPQGPGTSLDNDSMASSDKVTRGRDALLEVAKNKFFENQQEGESPTDTKEQQ